MHDKCTRNCSRVFGIITGVGISGRSLDALPILRIIRMGLGYGWQTSKCESVGKKCSARWSTFRGASANADATGLQWHSGSGPASPRRICRICRMLPMLSLEGQTQAQSTCKQILQQPALGGNMEVLEQRSGNPASS